MVRTNIYLEFLTILEALVIPERRIMAKMAEKYPKIPENPNKSTPRLVRWFKLLAKVQDILHSEVVMFLSS